MTLIGFAITIFLLVLVLISQSSLHTAIRHGHREESRKNRISIDYLSDLRELFKQLENQRDRWLDQQFELSRIDQEIRLKRIRIDIINEISNSEKRLNEYLDMTPTAREEFVSILVEERYNNTIE